MFWNTSYTYDEPAALGPTGGVLPPMPEWHSVYAMFHTHTPIPGYDYENYSDTDEDTADGRGIPAYLGTPSGLIRRYIPTPANPRGGKVSTVGSAACSCNRN